VFAESYKRGKPELRGQFNFGEKLFLSLCRTATISTTTGTVIFDDTGRHEHPRKKRTSGTQIEAVLEITREEIAELDKLLRTLLLPEGVSVIFNGARLPAGSRSRIRGDVDDADRRRGRGHASHHAQDDGAGL